MTQGVCVDYRDLPTDGSFAYGTKTSVSDGVGSENQSVSMIEFAPGEGGPLSYHPSPVEELYYVVSGRFEIQLDEETYTAEPGTFAYIPPGVSHRPTNVTDEPAMLLVVQTPSAKETVYVDE